MWSFLTHAEHHRRSESEFWQTLATVVVWGLGSSTILLLLLMGIWESLNFKK
jgi:multidrug efflux pump subunit AcrB